MNNNKNNIGFSNTLKCTNCGSELKLVSQNDNQDDKFWNATRRQYICDKCRLYFETVERIEVVKPIVYIIGKERCELFAEDEYIDSLNKALTFPFLYPTVIPDIVDSWYMYALHNSNAIITHKEDIRELRVAYTIDTLVEFTVKKLCEVGLNSTARDFLALYSDYLISNDLSSKLITKYNFEDDEEVQDGE